MASWRVVPWKKLYSILECVNNVLPTQLPAPFETRQFVDDLTTMSVANSEGDVTHSICSVALELQDELKKARPEQNKSTIVSNRKGPAKRVR